MSTLLTDEQFDVFSTEVKNTVIREFLLEMEEMKDSGQFTTTSEISEELEKRAMNMLMGSYSMKS